MALLARAREIGDRLDTDACCPACLQKLTKDFSGDQDTLEYARKNLHKLWDGCAKALRFPIVAHPSEMQRITGARCAKAQRALDACALHGGAAQAAASDSDVLHDFISAVCACLHACLALGETSAVQRAEHRKRAFENNNGHWPVSRFALWPSGEQVGVRSLLVWCTTMGTPRPLVLLGDMLRVAHPLVFDVLTESTELHKQLLLAIVRRLGTYATWATNTESKLGSGGVPLPPASVRFARANMRAAVFFLESMRDSPDALPNSLLRFVDDQQSGVFLGLQLVLVALEHDGGFETLADTVASLCASLYAHMPAEGPQKMLRPRILDHIVDPSGLTLFGVLHNLLRHLARTRRICSGPDCMRFTHQADARSDAHFSTCARCQIPRYCGTDCQREDWEQGTHVPHRLVCRLLRKLLAVASPDMPPAQFEAAARSVHWEPANLRNLSLFTLNTYRLPMPVLDRAADIHLALLEGKEIPDDSRHALASIAHNRRVFRAQRAGIPLSKLGASGVLQFGILE